jgi:hypothetical protein
MNIEKLRNPGRPIQPIDGDPLGVFLIDHFKNFALKWPNLTDLVSLNFENIKSSPDEYPMVGNPDLLKAVLRAAAFPEEIGADKKEGEYLFLALRGSPDFILALLAHLRKKIAALSPGKKAILYRNHQGKFSDAEKAERARLRCQVNKANKKRKAAIYTRPWLKNSPLI